MTTRDKTRAVRVGSVRIGGGNPVAVQSMTNTDTRDAEATIAQILALEEAGCEIVRAAVPDEESALAFRGIKDRIHIPLVADIHFSAELAVLAVENGADKLRINPGNIGGEDKVRLVADAARAHGVPIRVGVNAGSLEKELLGKYGVTARALAESAIKQARFLERFDFRDIVVAVKASDARLCLEAYRLVADTLDCPLHIGVTEAGFGGNGLIKSAVGIGAVLLDGLGDTLRVSLSGDPIQEVAAAYSILRAAGVRQRGVEVISCPTCARTGIDVEALAREVERRTACIRKPLKVAVMGCAVNGPGEAREADLGIAGGQGAGALFVKGEPTRSVPEEGLLDALMDAIERVSGEKPIK
jgi:(E)-4-hydroxy-3-methylbut-2-enyl-diphosphate synthase